MYLGFRASVNRSWSSGRSTLPTVTTPACSDESPDDDHHIREGHPEIDHPSAPLRTPHKLFVGVAPGIGSFHNPTHSGSKRSRLALLGNLAEQATSRQLLAGSGRIVGAVQMHPCLLRQLSERLQSVEGRLQQRRVVTVGRGDDATERDAFCVHHRRAFDASFSPIHRASSRFLPTARSLYDAPVHRQISQFEADEMIVGIEGDLPEILHQSQFDPLIAPATQRALRARVVGDPFVGTPEHQDLDQLAENHPVGDARPVTSERMVRLSLGQEGTELLEDGLDDVWLDGGHGTHSFSRSGSLENSPNDGASVPALHIDALPIDGSSKPEQIIWWFVRRWQMEATFQEVRQRLRFETQRHWSQEAIRRTAPALLGLFSLVTLFAHQGMVRKGAET